MNATFLILLYGLAAAWVGYWAGVDRGLHLRETKRRRFY